MARKRKIQKGHKPPPKCKAILLCDQVIIDRFTNKTSIIGIFQHFGLIRFPGLTPPVVAFLQLTNGIGKCDIVVEVHDLQSEMIIARASGFGVAFPDRLMKMNTIIPVPRLPMQHPGVYDFVVFADRQEIDRQQFEAVALQQPDEKGDQGDESQS